MGAPQCGTCRFWDDTSGRCHRYAPRPSAPVEVRNNGDDALWDYSLARWPITEEFDWCGEHKRMDGE